MKRFAENISAATTLLMMIFASYAFVLFGSFKTDANAKAVEVLQKKVDSFEEFRTDIAVIKEQIIEMNKKLDSRR